MLDKPERYVPSDLAKWLHDFPHIDLTFHEINDTFAPTDNRYRESLYFLASLPVVWLIITLIILSIYMCCRCCWCVTHTKPRKNSQKTCCLNWAVILLITICGILMALSFYGNEQADEGTHTVITSLHNVNKTIDEVSQRVDILDGILGNMNGSGIGEILSLIEQNVPNSTIKELVLERVLKLRTHCSEAKTNIDVIKTDTDSIHLDQVTKITHQAEFYRWLGTIVILCLVVLVCLGFLIGVVKRSRGILIASIVMSITAIVLLLAASGAYLGFNVAVSDLCVDPDDFISHQASPPIQPLVKKYLDCTEDPFGETITVATTSFTDANRTLTNILKVVAPFHIDLLTKPVKYMRLQVKAGLGNLTRLGGVVGCTSVHKDYVDALYGLCDKALLGLVFIMLTCFVIAVFTTFMICMVSTAWRHYHKSGERYESDDSDPFLPRPPPYNGYGAIPAEAVASVHGHERGDVRVSNRSSIDLGAYPINGSVQPGGSPPPAYSHNRGHQISYRRVANREEPAAWSDQIQPAADHGYASNDVNFDRVDYSTHGTFNR